jgi:hypothetical protein
VIIGVAPGYANLIVVWALGTALMVAFEIL